MVILNMLEMIYLKQECVQTINIEMFKATGQNGFNSETAYETGERKDSTSYVMIDEKDKKIDFYIICLKINIKNNEIYECVKSAWKLSKNKYNKIKYVFAINIKNSEFIGVYKVKRRTISEKDGRFSFEGCRFIQENNFIEKSAKNILDQSLGWVKINWTTIM